MAHPNYARLPLSGEAFWGLSTLKTNINIDDPFMKDHKT